MKKLTRLIVVLFVLAAFTTVASAAHPKPGPFSTTGYTTNLVFNPDLGIPAPSEFELLPNGYFKFHISAQGEVDGYFNQGSFAFDEWGVADASYAGANHGLMTITTDTGQADVRFGGIANYFGVTGSYAFLDGTGAYKDIKGQGAYTGDAGYVFSVDYTPCGGKDAPACPTPRCAVFGDDLKLKKDKAEWKITNNGEDAITISKVTVVWPEGPLAKVKLGEKTIYAGALSAPSAQIATGWTGKDRDRRIAAGKTAELRLEFDAHDISSNPWDYTILVEFAEGCAVSFVAFAP
jgi:hypothetical protein